MKFWELINLLNFKQLKSLFLIFIKHPLFVYPTFKATSNSMYITQKEFPNIHGKNNKANAFRHALWNILLVVAYTKQKKNLKKSVQFANVITLWHEDFSPNKPIEKLMDLHNNAVGRMIASELIIKGELPIINDVINFLHQKLTDSKQVSNIDEAQLYPKELIYLED